MATRFDIKFRSLAVKLIAKFGVTLGNGTIGRITPGTMDQDTGKIVNATSVKTVSMSPPVSYKQSDVDGTLIQKDDFKIYIAGTDWDTAFPGTTVQVNEHLTINGINVRVLEPNPIYSGDLIAAYAMQCRKGSADSA